MGGGNDGGASKIGTIVSITGSQQGTTLDGIATLGNQLGVATGIHLVMGQAAQDQMIGSPFVTALNQGGETVRGINYVNIATKYDEVVTPYSNAYITPAQNPAGASVTNIGLRPTFNDTTRTVIETHGLDVDRDLYDRTLRLGFIQRLRDERRFPDIDGLKAQIDADVRRAKRLFDRLSV